MSSFLCKLSRALAWADGEADLLAIVLRSEIELRGWAEFVSESTEKATQFLNEEVVIDATELEEKMRIVSFEGKGPVLQCDAGGPDLFACAYSDFFELD